MRWTILVLAAGCAEGPLGPSGKLHPGFEAFLEQGYLCKDGFGGGVPTPGSVDYFALDRDEHIRLEVWLTDGQAVPASPAFIVFTGDNMIMSRCSDAIDIDLDHRQHIDHQYHAISGTVQAVDDGSATAIDVEGVVLRAPGLPDVAMADGELPAF